MKKAVIIILFIAISIQTYASIGPVIIQGQPYTNLFLTDKNKPITVEKEKLIFDFSNHNRDSWSNLDGKITSTYEMVNTSDKEQVVKMAYAYVGSPLGILRETAITDRGKDIPFKAHIGEVFWGYNYSGEKVEETNYDFPAILDSIQGGEYTPENFSPEDVGTLYTITAGSEGKDMLLTVGLDFDSSKTKVFTTGFNRPEYGSKSIQGASMGGSGRNRPVTLFVLGEKTDFVIEGYQDYTMKDKVDDFVYEIKEETVSIKLYLSNSIDDEEIYINEDAKISNMEMDMRMQAFDETLSAGGGCGDKSEMGRYESFYREIIVCFDVVFPPNCTKEISINHSVFTSLDRWHVKDEKNPVFTNKFLFKVPDNWYAFENIDITVIPPEKAPYLTESNFDFTKNKQGVYHMTLQEKPDENLEFSLHADEIVLEKGFFDYPRNIASIVLLLIVVLMLIVVLKCVQYFWRKHLQT